MPRRLGGLLPEGVGGREGEGDYRESRFSMGVVMQRGSMAAAGDRARQCLKGGMEKVSRRQELQDMARAGNGLSPAKEQWQKVLPEQLVWHEFAPCRESIGLTMIKRALDRQLPPEQYTAQGRKKEKSLCWQAPVSNQLLSALSRAAGPSPARVTFELLPKALNHRVLVMR